MLRRRDRLSAARSVRARPPDLLMAVSHRNAMSVMHPRTLRSAVLASVISSVSPTGNVLGGRPSLGSSRAMRRMTSERVARRPAALTLASKTEKRVAEWVRSRHLRWSNHNRFAYQSSVPGAGAGSATSAGPMTVRSFLVHRRITLRSYVHGTRAFPFRVGWWASAEQCGEKEGHGRRGVTRSTKVAILMAMTVGEQMPLADVKNRLSEVVDRLEREHGRVVITKHGRPAAVIISVEDLESLEETLDVMDSAAVMDDIREALAEAGSADAPVLSKEEAQRLIPGR